jgi:hypothetical protein
MNCLHDNIVDSFPLGRVGVHDQQKLDVHIFWLKIIISLQTKNEKKWNFFFGKCVHFNPLRKYMITLVFVFQSLNSDTWI